MSTKLVKNFIAFCLVLICVPLPSVWAASFVKDPALEMAIRAELKLPSEKGLQANDMKKLESLYPKDEKDKITHLQGLEHAVNLQSLFLPDHNIKDISPISKLKKLSFLAIEGNQITDLSPLSGLIALETLVVGDNKIKSLDSLKKLSSLTDLLAGNNQISDLNPIKDLKLEWLVADGNKIQDLSPLKNHPALAYLYLDNNLIRNIEVLETIPNLQEVSLLDNPLNEQASKVVQRLKRKGIIVNVSKQEETQQETIKVILDAKLIGSNVPPFKKDGTTMVPLRVLFEELDLKVTWVKETQTIIGQKDGVTIKMVVGEQSAFVNGEKISLAAAPIIVSGSTFVPLRFVGEAVGAKVEWVQSQQTAIIKTKQQFTSSDGKVEATAYGKWTMYEDSSEYTKLAIQSFNWNKLIISETPKKDLNLNTDLATFYKDAKMQMLADSDIEVIEEIEESFKGHKAKKLVFSKAEEGWKYFVCEAIFFEAGGGFFQITAAANEDILEEAQKELDEMVSTIKISK